MVRKTPFVHPKLIKGLQRVGHFDDKCTIEEKSETRNQLGAEVENWEPLEDAIDIPCEMGIPTRGMMGKEFTQESSLVYSADYIIYLDRYYPDVENTDEFRLVVASRPLNIITFGHVDKAMTWFAVNEVR